MYVSQHQDNVLHSCVITAFKQPHLEANICVMVEWLQKKLDNDQWKQLVFEENSDGLYPLEFSAQQGTLLLFKQLLSSKGYIVEQENVGLENICLHDVTE